MEQLKKKRKRKRKIRLGAVLILILVFICMAAAVLGVWHWISYSNSQKEMKEQIALIQEEKTSYDQIMNSAKPADLSEESFAQLKTMASGSTDFSFLDSYQADEPVDSVWFEQTIPSAGFHGDENAYWMLEHVNEIPAEWIDYYLKDTDRFDFVKGYLEDDSVKYNPPAALSESLESVPHLLQWDLRWGYIPYGNSNIAYAGCGPTCLSMVFSYLNQDPSITPAALANWSETNGYYVNGAGTAHALLSDAPAAYGISYEGVPVDEQSIVSALNEGKILVLNMVPGHFTQIGHFIVATGMENGQIQILDPNSNERTRLWDLETVLSETAAAWAYWK